MFCEIYLVPLQVSLVSTLREGAITVTIADELESEIASPDGVGHVSPRLKLGSLLGAVKDVGAVNIENTSK